MTHTIEVEIDAAGNIHPVKPDAPLPEGRALLLVQTGPSETMLLSEAALAVDWLRPEEDAAWVEFQLREKAPASVTSGNELVVGK